MSVSDGLRNPFEKGFLKNLPKTFYWGNSPMMMLSGNCPQLIILAGEYPYETRLLNALLKFSDVFNMVNAPVEPPAVMAEFCGV